MFPLLAEKKPITEEEKNMISEDIAKKGFHNYTVHTAQETAEILSVPIKDEETFNTILDLMQNGNRKKGFDHERSSLHLAIVLFQDFVRAQAK